MLLRALLLLSLALVSAARAEPMPVVASFSILGDMVHEVGGDEVKVTSLVGPDGDAHVYQPSPRDAKGVASAKLVVINGLGLEGWMERLISSAQFKGTVVTASAGITPQRLSDSAAVPDPHAWQDIGNGEIYVQTIAAALEAADPEHAALYRQRADAYLGKLTELDRWTRDEIARVPQDKRVIITTHDAFQYFGRAYGVTFHAAVGMDEDSEPDAAGVAQLIRQIRREHIHALFIENMTDPRLIEQLVRETGTSLGGELFADALSKPGEGGETYLAMFRNNVPKMVEAMSRN
ncbi:MAG TPA: metal ABC transporter substrate-binding protein [Aliidongia sp.]|nr:metal ABC transporter substrate-binding protein [Aliidongia sp.]